MKSNTNTSILKIYLSSTDKFRNAPLYETIVFLAKRQKMAGATVLRGVMGFGASSAIASARFWDVSEKLPMVIEIVDEAEKVDNFFSFIKPYLDKVRNGCTVTIEKTNVVLYKAGKIKS